MGRIRLYRNISLTFIIFVAMLLAALFIFIYSQATIVVTADQQDVNLSFNASIKNKPTADEVNTQDVIAGTFKISSFKASGTFPVLSTKALSSDSIGEVKLINESNKSQSLLKTTQLQAASGVIVRTSEQVVVPASGSIKVGVYPKDPASFTDVQPGKLVIIKLNPALQDKIYGQVETTLSASSKEVKVLAQSDINKAKDELTSQAIASYRQQNNLTDNIPVFAEVTALKTDKKLGDSADNFNLSASVNIKVLDVNKEQITALIERKAEKLQLAGAAISTINPDDIKYTLLDTDSSGTMNVKVEYALKTSLTVDNPILGKSNFTGKTVEEVKDYAKSYPAIKNIEVYVSPYWRKTLPTKESAIKVTIK